MPSPFTHSRSGMSLMNVIVLLMLIGVLVMAGSALVGPLVKRGKINDTKTIINSNVDALVSWSVANGRIPDASTFDTAAQNPNDAWGTHLYYIYDASLASTTTNNLCRQTATYLATTSTLNAAFIVLSSGGDHKLDSNWSATPAFSDTASYYSASAALPIKTVTTNTADILRVVTLDELKNRAGCYGATGGRVRIVNNELPNACSGQPYNANLYADGGVPGYSWSTISPLWSVDSSGKLTRAVAPTANETVSITLSDSSGSNTQRSYMLKVIPCGIGSGIPQQFIHGSDLVFGGGNINGVNATIVLTGDLMKNNLNGGADIAVTNAYIDGDVTLGGSQTLGSPTVPGTIYINGNLDLSGSAAIYGKNIYVTGHITLSGSSSLGLVDNSAKIYALGNLMLNNGTVRGDIYSNANLTLTNATLNKNAYVGGNLTLGWTPTLNSTTVVYYKGSLSAPASFTASILAKCVQNPALPIITIPVSMPETTIPALRDTAWYAAHGYTTNGVLANNAKIFATGDYASSVGSATNVIIASKGNISLSNNNATISGVLYAPNGSITFSGDSFEGYAIARDGFYVTRGGSTVTLKPLSTYIPNTADYPFAYP